MTNLDDYQVIWLGADATTYAAPCERCRDDRRFSDVIEATVVEGTLRPEADVGFTACQRGHRIRVRRISRLRAVVAG
jgi:hypothetical protein